MLARGHPIFFQRCQQLPALPAITSVASNYQRCQQLPALPAISSVASNFQRCQQFPALPAISSIAAAPGKVSCLLGALGTSAVRYDLVMLARPAVFLDR